METLSKELEAQQLAFDTQARAYEQQIKVMQQNDENLRDQIGNYYNGDKAELMRQLGY